jgi:uncharacterized protein (TIGR02246 family)
MKIRSLLTLLGLAIGFALPTFAQQTNTPDEQMLAVSPQVREEIEAVFKKFQEAYNEHDAAAAAALYTEDAVEVRSWPAAQNGGINSGRQAIEKMFAEDFKRAPAARILNKIDNVYMIGEGVCVIMDATAGGSIGHAVQIYVPDASSDLWKIRMTFVSF